LNEANCGYIYQDLSDMSEPRHLPPNEVGRRAQHMMQQLRRDPLVARAVREVEASMRRGETRRASAIGPLDVLVEQRSAALLMLGAIDDTRIVLHTAPEADRMIVCVSVADALLRAEPYLWTGDIMNTAHAAPLPKHVVGPDLLPHEAMFWSTEFARSLLSIDGDELASESNWMLLTTTITDTSGPDRPIMIVRDQWSQQAQQLEIRFDALRFGEIYPDDFIDDTNPGRVHFARQTLSQLAFMASPYVTTTRARLPRPVRKELNREAGKEGRPPPPEPIVNVVELRREVRERVDAHERALAAAEGKEREYHHHWWVSGHFRAQWMPSTQSHNVIWIAPYLKGPLDKPLLDRRVYVVDR
jgi:hypothetical protein